MILLALLLVPFQTADTLTIGGAPFSSSGLNLGAGEVTMAAADVNEDGVLDLLSASQAYGRILVMLGDGDGGFKVHGEVSAGANPNDLYPADLNGDNHVDILVANHETAYTTVLLGNGKGEFAQAPGSPVQVEVDPHPHTVLAVDVDADGLLDLVVDDRNRGGLLVRSGRGDGSFAGTGRLINTGGDPYLGFLAKDLNGDGHPDFITPNPDHVAITESRPGGHYAAPRRLRTIAPFGVGLADLTGDGFEDLLVASGEGQTDVEIYLGPDFVNRKDRFPMSAGPKAVVTGDLNGDGLRDAVFCAWTGELMAVLGGEHVLMSLRLPYSGTPWGLLMADFNGDGRDDLVVADGSGSDGVLFLSLR